MNLLMSDSNGIIKHVVQIINEGQFDEAERMLKELLGNEPKNAEAHHQLGRVYSFIGLFDESLEELKVAVEILPNDPPIRVDLAMQYCMLGFNDEAKQEFEEVLRQDPNNEMAQRQIIYFR